MAGVMVVRRLPGWQERLLLYIAKVEREPFRYDGTRDCFGFVRGAVKAMTGADLCGEYVGRYFDRAGFHRLLKADGHQGLIGAMRAKAAEFGWPEVAEDEADLGDIAVLPASPKCSPYRNSLAIVNATGFIARTTKGLALAPAGLALGIWRIPTHV